MQIVGRLVNMELQEVLRSLVVKGLKTKCQDFALYPLKDSEQYKAPKAQDAELKLYLLLKREIRMGAISASKCFVS